MYIHDTQAKLEIENTNFSCDIFAPALESSRLGGSK
jgi:hypothetical protein